MRAAPGPPLYNFDLNSFKVASLAAIGLLIILFAVGIWQMQNSTVPEPVRSGGTTDHAPWVPFDQYQALKAENDRLRAENLTLMATVKELENEKTPSDVNEVLAEIELIRRCVGAAVDGRQARKCVESSPMQ